MEVQSKVKATIVIGYAIPRGGSSYLQYLLSKSNCVTVKLTEQNKLHPLNSSDGIVTLMNVFRGHHIKFVFLDRDNESIIKSHEAINEIQHLKPKLDAPMNAPKSKGLKTRKQILNEINKIRRNTDRQDGAKDGLGNKVNLLRLDYNNFDIDALAAFIGDDSVRETHEEAWMKKPIRHGRLSYGLK